MDDNSGRRPIKAPSLSLYFKHRLAEYAQRLQPRPHEDTCWYIGNLLERFCRSENFFHYDQGHNTLRPLALLYSDAVEARSEQERCLVLQHLGDTSLFMGALFPERFERRGIQQDYLVGMGGGAYDYLASRAAKNRHVFAELAGTFTRVLGMVANACSGERRLGAADIIALYERWLATRDPLVGNQLRAIGIDLSGSDRLQ